MSAHATCISTKMTVVYNAAILQVSHHAAYKLSCPVQWVLICLPRLPRSISINMFKIKSWLVKYNRLVNDTALAHIWDQNAPVRHLMEELAIHISYKKTPTLHETSTHVHSVHQRRKICGTHLQRRKHRPHTPTYRHVWTHTHMYTHTIAHTHTIQARTLLANLCL